MTTEELTTWIKENVVIGVKPATFCGNDVIVGLYIKGDSNPFSYDTIYIPGPHADEPYRD